MPASWYSSYPPLLLDLSWLFLSLLTSLVSPRSTPRPQHTWTLFPDMVAGWDLSLRWLSQSLAGVMKAAGGLPAYPCCASSFLPQPKVFLIRTLAWPGRLCSSWIISVEGSNGMCVCVAGRGPFFINARFFRLTSGGNQRACFLLLGTPIHTERVAWMKGPSPVNENIYIKTTMISHSFKCAVYLIHQPTPNYCSALFLRKRNSVWWII